MKDNRLTVGMVKDRMTKWQNLLGKPILMKLSDTVSEIQPDDIILGVDPGKPLFYVCSPKQKLRASEVTIDYQLGGTLLNVHYVIDDKFAVIAARVIDSMRIREYILRGYTGFFSGSISINLKPGRSTGLEALLDSVLCCMEASDNRTFEYVDKMYFLHRRTKAYWTSMARRGSVIV